MSFCIEAIAPSRLSEYASVPSVVEVKSMLVVNALGDQFERFDWQEAPIEVPYCKNYDAYEQGSPLDWPRRFNLSQWGLFLALDDGRPIGGVAAALNDHMIDAERPWTETAVLWDLRVQPTHKRHGVGSALFRETVAWAKSNGCTSMAIETQNVNVAACRFYANMGCILCRIDRSAYQHSSELRGEIMLEWHLRLPE
jgi:GNAT superfamily N-acetyltransferase